MATNSTANQGALRSIDPDALRENPENPRLVFREKEMRDLLESIREVGIKVPLAVYEEGSGYVLIDGERRWRCAKKLNLSEVPAIVQPKPTKLENLLMMFNIHNVRLQWDLMPMALKLDEIRRLLDAEGQSTTASALAGVTGLSVPTVRRALDLLRLPQRYQRLLLREAEKPPAEQRVTADVFVEVNKSQRVVENYLPQVFDQVSEPEYVDAMVQKYVNGVVTNVVRFRDISKIARAERAGEDPDDVAPEIVRLVQEPEYNIEDAYEATVGAAYRARDIASRAAGLTDRLAGVGRLSAEARRNLLQLRKEINRLLSKR